MKSARIRETVYTEYGIYYKLQHRATLIIREKLISVSVCVCQCPASTFLLFARKWTLGKDISTARTTKHRYYCITNPKTDTTA